MVPSEQPKQHDIIHSTFCSQSIGFVHVLEITPLYNMTDIIYIHKSSQNSYMSNGLVYIQNDNYITTTMMTLANSYLMPN